ncbi:MAG TPA: 2-C-methyl-D-erythritol 4-phosphate cytidylyltransferase [Steroidobacteraceae bacterium]|nr:2-C-methyl-D-erythritol 4-phosphate cytidylyltransferase [Steroidobacteraceae bacterium]
MHYWLVMPAAGAGRRFGSAKQYAPMGRSTVLETSLRPFLDDALCRGVALVLAADDPQRERLARALGDRVMLVDGGSERGQSVCNGLQALASHAGEEDWVLVHDAARPTLSAGDLARLLREGAEDAVGALLATPVADTIKRAAAIDPASAEARCDATVSREGLWLAQTPQMFRYGPLRQALERAMREGRTPTDEAQAMEWQGQLARLVASQDQNIKVTRQSDLALAESILRQRTSG